MYLAKEMHILQEIKKLPSTKVILHLHLNTNWCHCRLQANN